MVEESARTVGFALQGARKAKKHASEHVGQEKVMMGVCELKESPLEIKLNAFGKKFLVEGEHRFWEEIIHSLQLNEEENQELKMFVSLEERLPVAGLKPVK